MKIGIVINTYLVTENGEKNPFDHPTPLWDFEQANTLKATLESIRDANRRLEDELTLYLFGMAANEVTAYDDAIERKIRRLVQTVGGLPKARVITNRQISDLREETGVEFFESSGYPEIRNLGLLIPSMMEEELIMQLDDDELIRPNHLVRFAEIFEAHPEYGIVTAPYEKNGTVRILAEDPLPTWEKYSSMDRDLVRFLSADECQQTLFGFGGNLCLRTSVARDALYPRRVPRGEDFSFLLACRLLHANGDKAGGIAAGASRFLTWFCPEEAVTILHHPPVEAKAAFLRYFENNLNRFILERQMVMSQKLFTLEDLAGHSKYLFAMFGQKDFEVQLRKWIQEIRESRTDIQNPADIDEMERRLLSQLKERSQESRWQQYLQDRRQFATAQAFLSACDKPALFAKIRGWQM